MLILFVFNFLLIDIPKTAIKREDVIRSILINLIFIRLSNNEISLEVLRSVVKRKVKKREITIIMEQLCTQRKNTYTYKNIIIYYILRYV